MMKIYHSLRDFARALERGAVAEHAAAAAFFALISLSPFALLLTKLREAPVLLLSAAGVGALWAASHCVFTIIRGLNAVSGISEDSRGIIKLRLMSVGYTFALQIMLTASFTLWGIAVLFALILLLYRVLPDSRTPLAQNLPGAVFAAAGWVGFSRVFAYYLENHANLRAVYGSLAAAVASMLWLYFCMLILLAGAQINAMITVRDTSRGSQT
jgi:membrane protein